MKQLNSTAPVLVLFPEPSETLEEAVRSAIKAANEPKHMAKVVLLEWNMILIQIHHTDTLESVLENPGVAALKNMRKELYHPEAMWREPRGVL